MAVRIRLDKNDTVYTNLDVISGKAIVSIMREEAFSTINVKLECESRTRLGAPGSQGRQRNNHETELEVHKVIYSIR